MPDQMFLIVTIRKPVADRDEARQIYDTVKTRLADRPQLEITGHATNHFDLEDT